MICHIPVAIGELFDKYSILEIKKNKITDCNKLFYIQKEINHLKHFIEQFNIDNNIYQSLININSKLWEIEDNIRIKESKKEFDSEFIELARNVYIYNDERAQIKNNINKLFNSDIIEIKSYSDYS